MSKRKKVLVLGSTGSIGTQTLDVAKRHGDALEIAGLACGSRASQLLAQAREFDCHLLALGDSSLAGTSEADALAEFAAEDAEGALYFGEDGVLRLIADSDADIVVNSLVGAQGLRASYETLKAGKVLALANKESLVVGGNLIMPLAHALDSAYPHFGESVPFNPNGILMPIDSEHGAIFQCLLGEDFSEVENLWVTASGGPFRGRTLPELADVTARQALAHPTWNMGPKITIDSSTLMNKGLEIIEAHHLFDMPYDRIQVVVQPQSAIHSMVEFCDGSVKAHLGTTDMRIPIQFALSYPQRWESPVARMDFRTLGSLDFEAPDEHTFKCLALAREAGKADGTMPCVMNAANEVAVGAFLSDACGYLDIPSCVEAVMDEHEVQPVESIEQLVEVDSWAREQANRFISR